MYTQVGPQGPQGPAGEGSSVTVSETPPTGASEGDQWYDSTTGQSFIYYDNYWVELNNSLPGPQGQAGSTGPAGPSGVIAVTAPITNSGTSTSAIIGINQASLSIFQSQVINLSSSFAAKADLAGATFTGLITGKPNNGGVLLNSNDTGALSVRNATASDAASISFHRPGVYAINMGLDTDNSFKIGGWSAPAHRFIINTLGQVFGNFSSTVRDISAGYTIVNADAGQTVRSTAASAITVTITNVLNVGDSINFVQSGAGIITFTGSGVTLNSFSSRFRTAGQHAVVTLTCVASGLYVLSGNTIV
jgi:hypothetical protein